MLEDGAGQLRGAMPLYLKAHSWGEFVFDFAWADAVWNSDIGLGAGRPQRDSWAA